MSTCSRAGLLGLPSSCLPATFLRVTAHILNVVSLIELSVCTYCVCVFILVAYSFILFFSTIYFSLNKSSENILNSLIRTVFVHLLFLLFICVQRVLRSSKKQTQCNIEDVWLLRFSLFYTNVYGPSRFTQIILLIIAMRTCILISRNLYQEMFFPTQLSWKTICLKIYHLNLLGKELSLSKCYLNNYFSLIYTSFYIMKKEKECFEKYSEIWDTQECS